MPTIVVRLPTPGTSLSPPPQVISGTCDTFIDQANGVRLTEILDLGQDPPAPVANPNNYFTFLGRATEGLVYWAGVFKIPLGGGLMVGRSYRFKFEGYVGGGSVATGFVIYSL